VASALTGVGPLFSEILLALAAAALITTWPAPEAERVRCEDLDIHEHGESLRG
jgi:hypothetical protein